jgi:pantetheine-phosphate adenylyltransferase
MKTAIFPGSFDPLTKGHENIAIKAAALFDILYIAIGENSQKNNLFPVEKRLSWLKATFSTYPNIHCLTYNGLTVDFCKINNIQYIIRGLRSISDFENESLIADVNKQLYPVIETFFLLCDVHFRHISSSIVKEIMQNNGDIVDFIPKQIQI